MQMRPSLQTALGPRKFSGDPGSTPGEVLTRKQMLPSRQGSGNATELVDLVVQWIGRRSNRPPVARLARV
jgi:hypothetical protein